MFGHEKKTSRNVAEGFVGKNGDEWLSVGNVFGGFGWDWRYENKFVVDKLWEFFGGSCGNDGSHGVTN